MGNLERKKVNTMEEKSTVKKSSKSGQTKMISASINAENYEGFKLINHAKGMSNNSALNMLVADYVKENKKFLEE